MHGELSMSRASLQGECWENGSQTCLGEESREKRLGFVNKSQKGELPCPHALGIIYAQR